MGWRRRRRDLRELTPEGAPPERDRPRDRQAHDKRRSTAASTAGRGGECDTAALDAKLGRAAKAKRVLANACSADPASSGSRATKRDRERAVSAADRAEG
jgi:hypothetical protein